MKTYVQIFIVPLALALIASPLLVRADDDTETRREEVKDRIEERRAELDEKRAEMKQDIKQRMEEKRTELKASAKERIERHARKIIEKTNAMIARVERLVLRTESRVKKVTERGVDTAEATRFINQAKEEVALAKGDAGKLPQALTQALASTSPKQALDGTFKELLKAIKTNLKDAHRALSNAVSSIKAGINKGDKATTTPPVATTTAQ